MTTFSPIQQQVLRPKDAAKYLSIGLSTFWRYVQQGKISRGIRLSARCTVWRVSDLEAFLDKQQSEVTL